MPNVPQHLHILQHSLGLDQYGRGQSRRDHFATGEGSLDHDICVALVWSGLMTMRRPARGGAWGDLDFFFVTDAGRAYVKQASPQPPPEPKLTRSQRRYRRYLDSDSGWSFGEWLRSGWAREERSMAPPWPLGADLDLEIPF